MTRFFAFSDRPFDGKEGDRIAIRKTETAAPADAAVIYARYSSSGQREESIEGQVRDCREFARRSGLRVVAVYPDRALSGTSDQRPMFQKMIRDSESGAFSAVICWKMDRFARNRYDAAIYKARLRQHGVRLLYAKESIPEGPEGIILESIMEGFAEYYSANLSQNVKRGNYESALKRQTLGVKVYGLRKAADGTFEPDPDKAPIVQRIFAEYAAGKSTVDIIARLNASGLRTATGRPFNANSIRRILQNEKYAGVYRYLDIIEDPHGIPPLVSRETFDKVQELLKMHHEKPALKKEDGGFLLTGKLFCGHCGEPMTSYAGTGHNGTTYRYYICNAARKKKCDKKKNPKQELEDLVVRKLAEAARSDEIVNAFADRYMAWQEQEHSADPAAELEASLTQVESAIGGCLKAIESGFFSAELGARLKSLEAQKAELQGSISIARLEQPRLDRDSVIWFLRNFRDGDLEDPVWRSYLVDTFLLAAYAFDDGRLILQLNFTGDDSRLTLEGALTALSEGEPLPSPSSHFTPCGVPDGANQNSCILFYAGSLILTVTK